MFEELGIKDVDIINELDTVVRYDNIIIHPYVGVIQNINEIDMNESEVDHTFYVPVNYFLNQEPLEIENKLNVERPEDFPYDLIVNKHNYKFKNGSYRVLFYKYEDYNIWGITAQILNNFLEKLR